MHLPPKYTDYWMKVDASKAELAVDLVSDMLLNSKFEQAEMDRERDVIIERD
jgi:predicted Zn-dependent peptidase